MSNGNVWLTGGGSGIGKELAKILCDNGYNVIISGRRKDKLIETAKYNNKKYFLLNLMLAILKKLTL